MNVEQDLRSHGSTAMWVGCGTLAVITILGAVVRRAAGDQAGPAAAAVYGGGSFAMAWLTARVVAYPRWAWYGSAGVFALALGVAAVVLPAPAQVKEWTSTAWMMPWLYLVTALSPAPASGRCAPASTRGGAWLLGTSVLFSSILLGTWALGR